MLISACWTSHKLKDDFEGSFFTLMGESILPVVLLFAVNLFFITGLILAIWFIMPKVCVGCYIYGNNESKFAETKKRILSSQLAKIISRD